VGEEGEEEEETERSNAHWMEENERDAGRIGGWLEEIAGGGRSNWISGKSQTSTRTRDFK